MFEKFVRFVQEIYSARTLIPLHEPRFIGNEKKMLLDTLDSTFVSSVGANVDEFENKIKEYIGVKHAVATVNGTAALHTSLKLAGVKENTEVITQSLTFVATCNAIRYCNAEPVFVDVDKSTLGLSVESLEEFLTENCELRDDGRCWNKISDRPVIACVPMHTFGMPVKMDTLTMLCERYNIIVVEDAAESLGSEYKQKRTGAYGKLAVLSFNGNKIITTGGGGMVLSNDEGLARLAKHITTTAKIPHRWLFEHDEIGFNYRLPNLNAALGVAQMELLPEFVKNKRDLAQKYQEWGDENGMRFVKEAADSRSNYWLNAVITQNIRQRDEMLKYTNDNNVMTRPAWKPMHQLKMNQHCYKVGLKNTEWLYERLVNVPSSVVLHG